MKKLSILSIVLCCLLAVSCMNPQQKIDSIAKKLNKECPLEVGNGAGKIISVESLPGEKIKMNFRINTSMEMDETTKIVIGEGIKTLFVSMSDTDRTFKKLKDLGATVIVSISTPNNDKVDITITPEDFKNIEKVKLESGGVDSKDNMQTMLDIMVASLKKQLPMIDDETGIKTIDCYVDGMTMITVGELPDSFLKEIDSNVFVSSLKSIMVGMINGDPSMKFIVDKGVKVKYIYKKADGSIFAEQDVDKTDL